MLWKWGVLPRAKYWHFVCDGDETPETHDVRIDVGGFPSRMHICEVRAGDLLERRRLLVLR